MLVARSVTVGWGHYRDHDAHLMDMQRLKISIPDDINFADLKLSRDPKTGAVEFAWEPIERICEASAIDVTVFRDQHEDNVAGLITQWYAEHLAHGGERDPVQDELIAETHAEDERGRGLSRGVGGAAQALKGRKVSVSYSAGLAAQSQRLVVREI